MKHPTTIVFDLDGTLVHSAPDLRVAVNVSLAAIGRAPLDLEMVTSFVGNGVEVLIQCCLAATGGTSDALLAQSLARFHGYYDANLVALTRPYPGVVDCLNRLRALGVTMGICTNKPTEPARQICDHLQLSQYFDVVMGAQRGVPKKPDAAPLLACVAALGGDAQNALFVGDSKVDVQTARNAGIALRFFTGGYHSALPTDLPTPQRFDEWAPELADKWAGLAR